MDQTTASAHRNLSGYFCHPNLGYFGVPVSRGNPDRSRSPPMPKQLACGFPSSWSQLRRTSSSTQRLCRSWITMFVPSAKQHIFSNNLEICIILHRKSTRHFDAF
eukprot:3716709-Amphidinium_carterae.1